jgi:hypothetical protein
MILVLLFRIFGMRVGVIFVRPVEKFFDGGNDALGKKEETKKGGSKTLKEHATGARVKISISWS